MRDTLIADAIERVAARFPFPGYVEPTAGAYRTIAEVALRYLPRGASVLDFGCGPADKTAVLSELGYRCSAYDDLGDWWHKLDGNREKILEFARAARIDYRPAKPGRLPFEPESFDMAMLHDVLEHLHDSPRDLLNDLTELIKPGGFLFATVPNAVNIRKRLEVLRGRTNMTRFWYFYWLPGEWRGHIREYTKGDLASLSDFLGLERVELRAVDHMLQNVPRRLLTAYMGVTRLFPGFKDSWLLLLRKPAGWTARRQLPETEAKGLRESFSGYHD